MTRYVRVAAVSVVKENITQRLSVGFVLSMKGKVLEMLVDRWSLLHSHWQLLTLEYSKWRDCRADFRGLFVEIQLLKSPNTIEE